MPSPARLNQVGWLTLIGLAALFVFLGLLKFLVFLLFTRLVVDLLVDGLGGRLPYVSRRGVLYGVYAAIAALLVVIAVVVAPRFVSDLPQYAQTIDRNLASKVADLLAPWNISVDVQDLKARAMEWGRTHVGESVDLARRVGTDVVLLVVAFIITFVMTHDRFRERGEPDVATPDNLWRFLARFLDAKISTFYGFFRQVMAGQVVISLINATLTVGLLIVLGIPHKIALTILVFVFGLLPIVGNLISNTLICLSALLWTGPVEVVAALVFLVVIHKLEYFLNSKIIGNIVRLPMYLTLLGLIVGEALFHISGMILSIPVILFVRAELTAIKVAGAGDRASLG